MLRRLPLPPLPVPGRLIADRVAVAAAWPGFGDAVAQLQIDNKTLERLARGAAQMYAASGNFTVLHMLTSAHALRVLLPVLEPEAALAAVAAYWRAFAAAWAASSARDLGTVPLQPWARIVATAIAADDDHSAKLVDSCREQQKAYGGDVWRRAASRGGAGRRMSTSARPATIAAWPCSPFPTPTSLLAMCPCSMAPPFPSKPASALRS